MVQIDFYQISQARLESVLLMLLKKTQEIKEKALVLCPMPAASAIDNVLWSYEPTSWMVHGLDDAKGAENCDVWISSDMAANQIQAQFLFLLHGSTPVKWEGFKRSFCLFDGRSDAQLRQARSQWREWQQLSCTKLAYYAQNSEGLWDKKS